MIQYYLNQVKRTDINKGCYLLKDSSCIEDDANEISEDLSTIRIEQYSFLPEIISKNSKLT